MAKTDTSTSSKQALQMSEEEKAARNKALNTSGTMISGASEALKGFYGPGMDTWKRTQINQRTADTTKSFDDALAAGRLRARTAGFGYEQPAEQQQETNIGNARAGEIAKIPGQVEAESVPIALSAIGEEGNLANLETGIGRTYDPEGYYGSAVSQDQAALQRRANMWSSIIGGATGIASSLIPQKMIVKQA